MTDEKETLAWMAGIWEGEGTVKITGHYHIRDNGVRVRIFSLRVQVFNTQRDMLIPFLRRFGGSLEVRRHVQKNCQTAYAWTIAPKVALVFLLVIRPFVRTQIRRQQIALAIRFQRQKKTGGAGGKNRGCLSKSYHRIQRMFYERMKSLHGFKVQRRYL